MKVFIFNPEHDIALATHVENFTAPHAGREIRHDLGYLPMLWAEEGDYVLVDDVDACLAAVRRLSVPTHGTLISADELRHLLTLVTDDVDIRPWGWDLSLCYTLRRMGVRADQLPSVVRLEHIRQLSHRAWAAEHFLQPARNIEGTIGESQPLTSLDAVAAYWHAHHDIVLKAPWSSSGRGIRYLRATIAPSNSTDTSASVAPSASVPSSSPSVLPAELQGWLRHVIRQQGCVMGEPFYDKVLDLGVEFVSDGRGEVSYCGLSLFHTEAGAYTGNIIDTEKHKQERLSRYVDMSTFHAVKELLAECLGQVLRGIYAGPLGIDMMVVKVGSQTLLHPCVELNLRCTMGHVALAIHHDDSLPARLMRIRYTDKYRMTLCSE